MLNISETVRDRQTLGSKGPPIENGIWTIKWSHDRWRHVTSEGAVRQYGRLSNDSLASCWF